MVRTNSPFPRTPICIYTPVVLEPLLSLEQRLERFKCAAAAARASEAPRGGAAAGTAMGRRRTPHASPMPPACHPTPSACSPMPPTCNHTRPGTAARRPGHGHLQPRPAAQRSGLEHRRATALLRRSGLGFVRRDGERSHSASKQARVGKVRAHLPTHLLTYLGNGARLRSCCR